MNNSSRGIIAVMIGLFVLLLRAFSELAAHAFNVGSEKVLLSVAIKRALGHPKTVLVQPHCIVLALVVTFTLSIWASSGNPTVRKFTLITGLVLPLIIGIFDRDIIVGYLITPVVAPILIGTAVFGEPDSEFYADNMLALAALGSWVWFCLIGCGCEYRHK
jgi:hypothetical protein